MHVEEDQNIDIFSFWKHFMTETALHTNEILQRCIKYLVLNKIIITSTVKNCDNFNVDFCNKYAYL